MPINYPPEVSGSSSSASLLTPLQPPHPGSHRIVGLEGPLEIIQFHQVPTSTSLGPTLSPHRFNSSPEVSGSSSSTSLLTPLQPPHPGSHRIIGLEGPLEIIQFHQVPTSICLRPTLSPRRAAEAAVEDRSPGQAWDAPAKTPAKESAHATVPLPQRLAVRLPRFTALPAPRVLPNPGHGGKTSKFLLAWLPSRSGNSTLINAPTKPSLAGGALNSSTVPRVRKEPRGSPPAPEPPRPADAYFNATHLLAV